MNDTAWLIGALLFLAAMLWGLRDMINKHG